GVGEDELQLVRDEAPVERHVDGTDLADGIERLDELSAVHQQEGDTISLAHTDPAQAVGDAVGAGVELAVGQPTTSRRLDERLGVRREMGTPAQQVTNVDRHVRTSAKSASMRHLPTPRLPPPWR